MKVLGDIIDRSTQMVTACGLDSLSIFIRNRKSTDECALTYLYHEGVSGEAQHAYRQGRVFEDDPFTHILATTDRTGSLIRWEDNRLSNVAGRATNYREFINNYGVDVVGAWVQQLLPDFLLVIGTHCRPGGHAKSNVPMDLLEYEITRISQMVVGQILENVLNDLGGDSVLQYIVHGGSDPKPDGLAKLSPREQEIARLVGEGKQNKQIAYLVGISEFTVENHLRRIYQKLGVHNRTAMTAHLFDRPTYQ